MDDALYSQLLGRTDDDAVRYLADVFGEGFVAPTFSTLAQVRTVAAFFLVPEAAAWCLLLLFSAKATISNGSLVLTRGARRVDCTRGSVRCSIAHCSTFAIHSI